LNFKEYESDQKLRGGYYTPPDLAAFIARWVAVNKATEILEPSCGDGVFFEALASASNESLTVRAFELDAREARKARARASRLPIKSRVSACDFLGWALRELRKGSQSLDAVVGNPPFIRYQYLPTDFQTRAESIFRHLGCRFTKHTNAWVPFILASIALLRPGGRLGMVIPAELIHVTHAQSLRSFLGSACSRLVIIDPERLWFSGTLQGAVILLAEKRRNCAQPAEGLGIVPVKDREFAEGDPEKLFRSASAINGATIQGKWTRALLDTATRELLDTTEEMPAVRRFVEVAEVDVGIVTGANKFFLIPDETVDRYSLHNYVYPMFGRSEHCPGVVYDRHQHAANVLSGKPTNFLWLKDASDVQDCRVKQYIRLGEEQNLHERYKCRIRSPWYRVPSVYATDIGMLKRSHHAPRLILNEVRAFTTDTAYRITTSTVTPRALVSSFLNPLTALSAELEGRHYGGGVLELVPSEIERLLVALPPKMDTNLQSLDHAVRTNCTEDVLADHGQRVLSAAGLGTEACEQFLHAWLMLRNRRQRVSEQLDAENSTAVGIKTAAI
jgi:adenine-specific DNA methylase